MFSGMVNTFSGLAFVFLVMGDFGMLGFEAVFLGLGTICFDKKVTLIRIRSASILRFEWLGGLGMTFL